MVVDPLAQVSVIVKIEIERQQDERGDVYAKELPSKPPLQVAEVGLIPGLLPERGWKLVTVHAIRLCFLHKFIWASRLSKRYRGHFDNLVAVFATAETRREGAIRARCL